MSAQNNQTKENFIPSLPMTGKNLFEDSLQWFIATNRIAYGESGWSALLGDYEDLLDADFLGHLFDQIAHNKNEYGTIGGRLPAVLNPPRWYLGAPHLTKLLTTVSDQALFALEAVLKIKPDLLGAALEKSLDYAKSDDLNIKHKGFQILSMLVRRNRQLATADLAEFISTTATGFGFKGIRVKNQDERQKMLLSNIRYSARNNLREMFHQSPDILTPTIVAQIEQAAIHDPNLWEREQSARYLYDPMAAKRPDMFTHPILASQPLRLP